MKLLVVTGMDGAGKTTLIESLKTQITSQCVRTMHLPFSGFVKPALQLSGEGTVHGDTWTDRLIFALDNRLAGYELASIEASRQCDLVITQRGWMDGFVFGAAQGYDYETVAKLCRVSDLPPATCSVYLNCDPNVAYERIKHSKSDKFETLTYMRRQYGETLRFYNALNADPLLKELFKEPRVYIDTSKLTREDLLTKVLSFLKEQDVI